MGEIAVIFASGARARGRWRTLLIAVLALFALGGCAGLNDVIELGNQVEKAGYQQVQVNHRENNGRVRLTVGAVTAAEAVSDQDSLKIAKVVWENYPQRIDELMVSLNGRTRLSATYTELEKQLGTRKPELNKTSSAGMIAGLVLLGLIAAVVALIVLRVRRKKRMRREQQSRDLPLPPVPNFEAPQQDPPR